MYAPIDPERRQMEDILRSLGAVLDAHLARGVVIKQQDDGLIVRAHAVASIAERLEGAWAPMERVLTHVDIVQAQVAAVARRRTGHGAGLLERTLRVVGRLVDERGLRGLTLIQHASSGVWLLWHEGAGHQRATLITLTVDELLAADAAAAMARDRRARSTTGPVAVGRGQWGRRPDPEAPRSRGGYLPREMLPGRPGRGMLVPARVFAER